MYLILDREEGEIRLLTTDENIQHHEECSCEEQADEFFWIYMEDLMELNVVVLN